MPHVLDPVRVETSVRDVLLAANKNIGKVCVLTEHPGPWIESEVCTILSLASICEFSNFAIAFSVSDCFKKPFSSTVTKDVASAVFNTQAITQIHQTPHLACPSKAENLFEMIEGLHPETVILEYSPLLSTSLERIRSDSYLYSRFREDTDEARTIFHALLLCISSIESVKSLAVTMPRSVCSSPKNFYFRSKMSDSWRITSIINLPQENFFDSSTQGLAVVSFRRLREGEKSERKALFLSISGAAELSTWHESEAAAEFKAWQDGKNPKKIGFVTEVRSSSWDLKLNHKDLQILPHRLKKLGNLRKLEEIAEIWDGPIGLHVVRDGEVSLIRAENISSLGMISESKTARIPEDFKSERLIRPFDILVPKQIRPQSVTLNLRINEAIPADDVIVLRLRPESDVSPYFLTDFLNSLPAQTLLESHCQIQTNGELMPLAVETLAEMIVPQVTSSSMTNFGELFKVESALLNTLQELRNQRAGVFGYDNGEVFSKNVETMLFNGRTIQYSLARAVDRDFRLSNFYPTPMVIAHRNVASELETMAKCQQQFRCLENILAFLGSICLALLCDAGRLDSKRLELIDLWQIGATEGKWRQLIGRASEMFREQKINRLSDSIASLEISKTSKPFGEAVSQMVERRNDFHHNRGLSVTKLVEENEAQLEACFAELDFMTVYPVREVIKVDPLRNGMADLLCLRMQGDHPSFKQEMIRHKKPLPKDIFLELDAENWIPLFPFVSRESCEKCESRETYFIEKWQQGSKRVAIKSFERGHQESCGEVADGLDEVFSLAVPVV